eukprot:Skav226836  [mRNA]  locus=scaffold1741:144912:155870:- [translate_table: standard]
MATGRPAWPQVDADTGEPKSKARHFVEDVRSFRIQNLVLPILLLSHLTADLLLSEMGQIWASSTCCHPFTDLLNKSSEPWSVLDLHLDSAGECSLDVAYHVVRVACQHRGRWKQSLPVLPRGRYIRTSRSLLFFFGATILAILALAAFRSSSLALNLLEIDQSIYPVSHGKKTFGVIRSCRPKSGHPPADAKLYFLLKMPCFEQLEFNEERLHPAAGTGQLCLKIDVWFAVPSNIPRIIAIRAPELRKPMKLRSQKPLHTSFAV